MKQEQNNRSGRKTGGNSDQSKQNKSANPGTKIPQKGKERPDSNHPHEPQTPTAK